MADIKVTNAPVSGRHPLQKIAVSVNKDEGPPQAAVKRVDEAVRVLVDARIEKLAAASPPPEQPAITEPAARQLALDVRQKLKDGNLSFVGAPEKSILSQFS